MAWNDLAPALPGFGFDIDPITGQLIPRGQSPMGQSVGPIPPMPLRPPGFTPPPMPDEPRKMLFKYPPQLNNAVPPPPDYPTQAPNFPPPASAAPNPSFDGVGASSLAPGAGLGRPDEKLGPQGAPGAPPSASTAGPVGNPSDSSGTAPDASGSPQSGASPDLLGFIKGQEGFTPKAKWDYKQFTNGYGTRANAEGEDITEEEAQRRLVNDVDERHRRITAAASAAGMNLNPNQINALVSFDYNTGRGADLIAQAGNDPSKLPALMLQFTRAGNEELPGLVRRRQAEVAMFTGQGMPAYSPGSAPASANAQYETGGAPKDPTQPQQGSLPGVGANSMFANGALRPTQGDRLLAIASGLLSGPNLGQGLGKGLQALQKLNADDREAVIKGLTLENQTARLDMQNRNVNSQITDRDRRANWRELSGTQRLALAQQAVDLRARGNDLAARKLEDQIGGGATIRRENVKAAADYGQAAETALRVQNAAQDLVNVIDSGAVTSQGPALEDRLKRFMTNISGGRLDSETQSASGQALFDKLAHQLGNAGALAAAGGRLPRANAEFQQFLRGSANGNMNIDALKALAQKMAAESGAIVQGYNRFNTDPDAQMQALGGLGGVRAYQNRVLEDFYQNSPHFQRSPAAPGGQQRPFTYQAPNGGPTITIQ